MKIYAIRTEKMGPSDLVEQADVDRYQNLIRDEIKAAGINDVEVVVVDGKYDELPRGERLDDLHPGLGDALERAWERFCGN